MRINLSGAKELQTFGNSGVATDWKSLKYFDTYFDTNFFIIREGNRLKIKIKSRQG